MTYKYDVIPLTEGLDFNTATSLTKPGSLRDCMNYEFVDGAGLRRINGFRPYDGTNLSPQDKLFFIKESQAIASDTEFAEWAWLYVEDSISNPNKVPFGYLVNGDSTLPAHTVGPTTYTLIPFVKINCPKYADPYLRPDSTVKILNSSALSVAASIDQFLSAGELTTADYNAVFSTTTQSAVTELAYLRTSGSAPEKSNNVIRTANNGAGSPPSDQAGTATSTIAEMWCEEKDGVTYSIGDPYRAATTANGLTIYPGDYMFGHTGVAAMLLPWLVINVSAPAGFGVGEQLFLYLVPLRGYVMESGVNHSYKQPGSAYYTTSEGDLAPTALRLYRNPGTDATDQSVQWNYRWGEVPIEEGSDVAVVWSRHSEEGGLTADSVYSTDSVGITGGTGHAITWTAGVPAGITYTDTNTTAEYMPLLASGVVKAVIPTKPGTGYSGTGTVTYANNGVGSGGANTTYRANCIERVYPRFHHTGWIVPFDVGNKTSGFFNKIDRYKNTDSNAYDTDTVANKTCTLYLHNIQNSTVPYSGTGNQARIFQDQWKTTTGSNTDSDSIVAALLADDGTTITNSYNWGSFPTSSTAFTATSGWVGFGGIDGAIPQDSVIKGISVSVKLAVSASTDSATIYDDGGATLRCSLFKNNGSTALGSPLEMLSGSGSLKDSWSAGTMAETTFTAGSSSNTWGNTPLKLSDVTDPTFGVSFDIKLDRANSAVNPTGTFRIDQVQLSVEYELPSVRLYFTEGAGGGDAVITGDVLDYVISKGALETGDAEGYLTVVNVRTVHGASGATKAYYSILNDYYIYNNPALTSLVGRVSGNMEFNGCDSYKAIKAEGSLYTSHQANLYANADYDSFFICSGAGRARIFDGKYLSKAYAINPSQTNSDDLDKPRHCTVKNFSLFLGYESGQVLFSAPGDPGNFSAFDGAGEIGVGDNVVGLENMPGNSLCVACRNSMHAIVGTSADDYALQTLVAKEGAYEYSVAAMGGQILYTTNGGIKTLDQSEKYGNFVPRPLSFKINPWLLPRMSSSHTSFKAPSTDSPPIDGGVAFVRAHAVPYRNQYRMYFKDGSQCWMTMLDAGAEFTFVKYAFVDVQGPDNFAEWRHAGGVHPLYVTTTTEKAPHVPHKTLMCFDPEQIARGVGYDYALATGLYIADVGDFFGSTGVSVTKKAIPYYFTINYNYMQNPFQSKTLRKVRLEGQTTGQVIANIYAKDGYVINSDILYDETSTPLNFPATAFTEVLASPIPESAIASVAATGRVISILVAGQSASSLLATAVPSYDQPSHLAQALFVQYEEGKEDA